MKNKNTAFQPIGTSLPLRLCILLGIFLLAVYTVLCALDVSRSDIIGICFLCLYLMAALAAYLFDRQNSIRKNRRKLENMALSTVMSQTVGGIGIPFVITDKEGKIIWHNKGFSTMIQDDGSLFGVNLSEFCQISPEEVLHASEGTDASGANTAKIGEHHYMVRSYGMVIAGKQYYMSIFSDITSECLLRDEIERDTPVVAYVVIDNLDELAQYVRVSSREAASQAEAVLKKWAESMDALIREYDRDKYILIFTAEDLAACIEEKFPILEQIRDIRVGDSSMPITVSMGISALGDTISEREQNARSALDMALQRGGDQVALRQESGLEYFGGRTKNIQKKTKVMARVIAGQLLNLISSSGNVIIMGHRNPDFDSIGSCVGLARLCMHCGVSPKIIINKSSESFRDCTGELLEVDMYKDIFTDAASGMDLIRSDTLLIIADANNLTILEEPAIAENVHNIAIIDHHRKTAEFKHAPLISYIDPSASSACELVAEILEECLPAGSLLKEEATVMLSGVMVDTKNFTRSTGIRTFSAALYLRGEGGSSEQAYTFFDSNLEDFHSEAKFGSNVTVYRENIAITTSVGSGRAEGDRIAASKAADKLLTLKNVAASFALVIVEDTIHISARSDGSVNVQLILERVGGGGHFNIAGARMPGQNMKEALMRLKAAIDDYLDTQG